MTRAVFRRSTPVMKSPDDNYQTPSKTAARQFVIDAVIAAGVKVESILTLPGRDAICVRQFQRVWPRTQTSYLGIERDQTRLKSSVIAHLLDDHLGISLSELAAGKSALVRGPDSQYFAHMNPIRRLVPNSNSGRAIYGPFDFSYLDFCGHCTPNTIKDIARFLTMVSDDGIIGVTFSLNKKKQQTVSDLIGMLKNIPVEIVDYFTYNTRTNMVVFVLKKLGSSGTT